MSDEELIRLYEEFSEDVYHAGFMDWEHRPAILFEDFPRWLKGRVTEDRTDYQQALVDAWRNHDHDEDEEAVWAALADLQGDA